MQFALSILEDRVDEKNRSYVVDVKEEVELMSKLVGELLAYSKAGIKTTEVNLVKIPLRPLVETVIEREKATETAEVEIIIADNIEVLAQPELLSRAIANVVRNVVRYAGEAGEIKVSATNGKNQVKIEIADNGAGVPEDALEKLFDRSTASNPTARGRAAEQVWVWQSSKPASKHVKGKFQRAIEFRKVWR